MQKSWPTVTTTLDPSCSPSFGNSVKAMMKMKTKKPTYRYELATRFNTLQQHVAQHPLQCSQLPASFNKPIVILTDTQRVDGSWMTVWLYSYVVPVSSIYLIIINCIAQKICCLYSAQALSKRAGTIKIVPWTRALWKIVSCNWPIKL